MIEFRSDAMPGDETPSDPQLRGLPDDHEAVVSRADRAIALDALWIKNGDSSSTRTKIDGSSVVWTPSGKGYCQISISWGVPRTFVSPNTKKPYSRLVGPVAKNSDGEAILCTAFVPLCRFLPAYRPERWLEDDYAPFLRSHKEIIALELAIIGEEDASLAERDAQMSRARQVAAAPGDEFARSIAEGVAVALQNLGVAQKKR
jgi:hypothetical protein